jgi:multimeric flavodoxin WrbA
MMKIAAVYGSPAKDGNSAVLTDAILKAANENGHTAEKFYLYDLEIKNCLACEAAATYHKERYCIHDDDMTAKIIPALREADLIIIASPIYMGQITGITKTFLDRWYTFILQDYKIRFLTGKKFITVVTSAAPDKSFLKVTEYLNYWLSDFFQMTRFEQLHAGNLMGSGAVNKREDLLQKAAELGKKIR